MKKGPAVETLFSSYSIKVEDGRNSIMAIIAFLPSSTLILQLLN